jgi:hypothetical protein
MRPLCDCSIHTYSHRDDLARPRRTLQETQASSRQVSKKIKKIKQIQKTERKALWTLAVTSQCRIRRSEGPEVEGPEPALGFSESEKNPGGVTKNLESHVDMSRTKQQQQKFWPNEPGGRANVFSDFAGFCPLLTSHSPMRVSQELRSLFDALGMEENLDYVFTAFMAATALQSNGQTMHHLMGANLCGDGDAANVDGQRLQIIIVDEISMVDAKLLSKLDVKVKFKCKKSPWGMYSFGGCIVIYSVATLSNFRRLQAPRSTRHPTRLTTI